MVEQTTTAALHLMMEIACWSRGFTDSVPNSGIMQLQPNIHNNNNNNNNNYNPADETMQTRMSSLEQDNYKLQNQLQDMKIKMEEPQQQQQELLQPPQPQPPSNKETMITTQVGVLYMPHATCRSRTYHHQKIINHTPDVAFLAVFYFFSVPSLPVVLLLVSSLVETNKALMRTTLVVVVASTHHQHQHQHLHQLGRIVRNMVGIFRFRLKVQI
jgi:hypothetical protein